MAGQQVRAEMGEQPDVLAGIVTERAAMHERLRAALPQRLRGICLVARGSSDNVAIQARYLLELATGLPVSMAAPVLSRPSVLVRAPSTELQYTTAEDSIHAQCSPRVGMLPTW